MTRRKVLRQAALAQTTLELPSALEPVVEGNLALALAGTAASGPEPVPAASSADAAAARRSGLPPLTKAQVHYWQELSGELTRVGTAGVPSADDFPPTLRPNRAILKAMVAYGILARRHRAWHLTRP